MRIHNIRPGVIGYVRKALETDYCGALRVCQLFGYVQHLHVNGHRFSQAHYCRLTGCHRSTIRKDLALMVEQGWVSCTSGSRGTWVLPMGIPYEPEPVEMDTGCPPPEELDGHGVSTPWTPGVQLDGHGVSTNKKLKNPTKNPPTPKPEEEEEDKQPLKDQILKSWNKHRPSSFQKLNSKSLTAARLETISKAMKGAGGLSEFVARLPAVLESLKDDPFWNKHGRTGKPWTWENFFGTAKNPKQHLAQALDASADQDPVAKPDRQPLRFIEFSERWSQTMHLDQDRLHSLAVEQVRQGAAPIWALELIENWKPELPVNEPIRQLLA